MGDSVITVGVVGFSICVSMSAFMLVCNASPKKNKVWIKVVLKRNVSIQVKVSPFADLGTLARG